MIGSSLLSTVAAFLLALGVLIVVHEFGHFLLARWLGVKVLRFSVGFGKPLISRRFGADQTEWALTAFPLGGYVKMLDEREGPVAAADVHRAFNRQPLWRRTLIVLAGPIANLLLAVLLYAALFTHGVEEMRPLLAAPVAASAAERAGIAAADQVRAVSGTPIATMQELRWQVMECVLDSRPAVLETIDGQGNIAFKTLDTSGITTDQLDTDFVRTLGLLPFRPNPAPVVGMVAADSAAANAGFRVGDFLRAVDGQPIAGWIDFVERVRAAPDRRLRVTLDRGGERLELDVTPLAAVEQGVSVGKVGLGISNDPAWRERLFVTVRLDPLAALAKGASQTGETSLFTLRMIGRMIIGDLSWRNISGPVTIADYAGQSAHLGLEHYLKFLALISISLGVLNLLPIPVLDGGHLLYYLLEAVKGEALSERATEIGQQIGLGLLALLMAVAFFNDFNRLLSG
jgi:regulator of sigma E protease